MDEFLLIATVLRPQGVRGEIKIKPLTDRPEDIRGFKRIYIDGKARDVLSVRVSGEFAYLTLSGVADRNAAELLRSKEIFVSRRDAPKPEDGRYYIADLIGCAVLADGKEMGKVTDVIPAKTDVYVLDAGGRERVFAAADGVILDIDIPSKTITVDKKRFEECALYY
ncbi:MAG: ribosome maturation factor RimM [Clostridia bacterium]|nr:ribosome maturation factor RimM [Clostridia bacterium]